MSLSKITDILLFSNDEISNAIIQIEKELFYLRFKKATRQSFNSHEIKQKKCKLVHFKTVLASRLKTKTNQYFNKND
jgi:ribosomal protein L29